mmetsp:Transcript_2229/g.8216  ORF Transcript_2229/g.8216 Transcript_2229/m.8216 type:complete len:154 (+) Transcript_2229:2264-2725(+)
MTRVKALYNQITLADCLHTPPIVEGIYFFPPQSVHHQHLIESGKAEMCEWRGLKKFLNVDVRTTQEKLQDKERKMKKEQEKLHEESRMQPKESQPPNDEEPKGHAAHLLHNAAFFYPHPKESAMKIQNFIAFTKNSGVRIVEVEEQKTMFENE